MKMRLIISLLVVCLAMSIGLALAQTGEDNVSQMGNQTSNLSNISQMGNQTSNLSTGKNISTLSNKMVNVSQQYGGNVRWILPGERRLDPTIFGTPQRPLGFEPEIGVPIEQRLLNQDETAFTTTNNTTPYSDRFARVSGTFTMNLTDRTPVDVNQSRDTARAQFRFTDPTGKRYIVVLRNVTYVGQHHPVLGGVDIDGIAHGRTSIDTRLEPTSYVYGAVWGVGELYINDTLVSDNRVIHAMATERIRSSDEQGYRLLIDRELPHRGIQAHLVMPDMVMAANGTMQKEPVPTNYTLPNGQEQPFIHVAFDSPQLEGLNILDFNNATMDMTGMTENMTGNMTGNMTQNQTQMMTQNQTQMMTQNQTQMMANETAMNETAMMNETGMMGMRLDMME